jgi:hypothetical protein
MSGASKQGTKLVVLAVGGTLGALGNLQFRTQQLV